MSNLNFLVSLVTEDNDYQRYQAAAAEEAGRRAGIGIKVLFADSDPLQQSEQILKALQTSDRAARPDGIVVQCVGTELRSAAELAIANGIGWAALNRDYCYRPELRPTAKAPIFAITADHNELGRMQGRQLVKLLPNGGTILYILGPSLDKISAQRLSGFEETKPANVEIRIMRGRWTAQSGKDAIHSWLRISTSLQTKISAIVSQNDDMAIGARNALHESGNMANFASVPLMGIDGVPESGQSWVKKGWLISTINVPPLAGIGVTMLAQAMRSGVVPPENTIVGVESFPALEHLHPIVPVHQEIPEAFAKTGRFGYQSPLLA